MELVQACPTLPLIGFGEPAFDLWCSALASTGMAFGWTRDEQNSLILLKVPASLDLRNASHCSASAPPTNFLSLPAEIHLEILEILHPIDRVCLALTCKRLTNTVITAPRFRYAHWTTWCDLRYSYGLPDWFSLIPRLAHGWTPKDKLRYCWKCHRILPREAEYCRKRMTMKKSPKWSLKIDMAKNDWSKMSKKSRYTYLIDHWCQADIEDGSYLHCDSCRREKLENGSPMCTPIECPMCMERELTFTWKPPRRRRFWSCFRGLCSATCEILGFILGLLALLIEEAYHVSRSVGRRVRTVCC